MKRIGLLTLSVLALVSALILATTGVASATGSQRWNLDQDVGAYGKLIMEKSGTQSGTVDFVSMNTQTWLTDEAAVADVTFPSGSWVIYLAMNNFDNDDEIDIAVGKYNPGFSAFGTVTGTYLNMAGNVLQVEIQTGSETIPEGEYLALQVTCDDTDVEVITDVSSYLVSPNTDPGYPLPEVAAGILLGIGLIGLGSYVAIRRKRTETMHS